jgi:predicted transcriptional regulator of viral defense system
MIKKLTYNYIDAYLTKIQAKGRYSVTLDELKIKFNTSEKAILQNIYRLKSKNQLAQVRREFYVIIPPQYSVLVMVPPALFIDDMMEFLDREYYVGLFSAAALHGAGHQQPMEFQVMIKTPPLRSIKNKKLNISFFTRAKWEKDQIVEKKTETGYINVSSPELTAFDLVSYSKKIGGLNRIVPILEDLTECMKTLQLRRVAASQKITAIQRLGYLLDKMGNKPLANTLYKIIEKEPRKKIPLSQPHKSLTGIVNEKWKVLVNTELDI